MKKVCLVVGTRPNFMKIAPLIRELVKRNIRYDLIHTGQHYDRNMSQAFFDELEIPKNSILNLKINSSRNSLMQIAEIMVKFERVIQLRRYSCVIVVGDVNSTLAASFTTKRCGQKLVHIEAGLRSFNSKMPEEFNRILIDRMSDILFITEKSAMINLKREGITHNVYFVGNIMIDNLIYNLSKMKDPFEYKDTGNYGLITLHRPSNVDDEEKLNRILYVLKLISGTITLRFIFHPRTQKRIKEFKLEKYFIPQEKIEGFPSVGPLEFLRYMIESKFILTDSGGIQEEASYLNIPVLTMRNDTERPITVERGTNTIVGDDLDRIIKNLRKIFKGKYKKAKKIEFWDGKTSERIVDILIEKGFIEQ